VHAGAYNQRHNKNKMNVNTFTYENEAFKKELKKQGFKLYTHRSGFQAWSIENLCEVSDEWSK
jgi:hypothetical protein